MLLLASERKNHNSKLYFSKEELKKIFACYSLGVSKGSWKDYAIYFGKQESSFYMFKNSFASPDCILTKSKKHTKNSILYKLDLKNKTQSKFTKIDNVIALLVRKEFKII